MPRYSWPSRFRSLALALLLLAVAGCAGQQPASPAPLAALPQTRPGKAETVSLLTHGWHTDIAVPARELSGPLTRFESLFPGARSLVFGYGKRTFMIAPVHSLGEWLIGPFPGPAALEVSAINTTPATAYGPRHTITLPLPPGGAARLSAYLWRAFAKNKAGHPIYIAQGNFPGSLFFEAEQRYGLLHTCNTWSAEALAAAGLPVRPAGMIFSAPLDDAAARIASRSPRG